MRAYNLSVLKDVKKKDDVQSLLKELQLYKAILNDLSNGQEGVAGIPKLVVGVVDIFLRIGNTIKTDLIKFNQKLKRSELRYFSESNMLKVAKVEDTPYATFVSSKVYAPTGMVGTYINAVDNIADVYVKLALTDTIIPLTEKLCCVERMLQDSDNATPALFTDLATSVKTRKVLLVSALAANDKIFTTKHTQDKVAFESVYSNMPEFKAVRSRLIELESNLKATANLAKVLENTDSSLTSLTTYLSNMTGDIDKAFINNLITIIEYVGMGFDTQGKVTLQQMSLEHNHVLNIQSLYKEL